jgi:hypothetical protein
LDLAADPLPAKLTPEPLPAITPELHVDKRRPAPVRRSSSTSITRRKLVAADLPDVDVSNSYDGLTLDAARLAGRHFQEHIPPTAKKARPTRVCKVCSKLKKRRETSYQCSTCKVSLCVIPCFEIYHTVKEYGTVDCSVWFSPSLEGNKTPVKREAAHFD